MGHLKLAAAGRYHGANRVIVGVKEIESSL
jgi:hypothetical protein